jgi:hypothetical protein
MRSRDHISLRITSICTAESPNPLNLATPAGPQRPGQTLAPLAYMKIMLSRFRNIALLQAVIIPLAIMPGALRAQDHETTTTTVRTYHDTKNNQDHEWNDREDQAYRAYNTQKHHKTVEFSKLKPRDQQTYWNWRSQHSDALLKIDIK